jgi:hypothetical protein
MTPKITAEALFAGVQTAWDDARGERAMPRRQDIDAAKIGALLPYVGLIDVLHGERIDLRYRLVGGQTTQSFGFNLTGHVHSELSNPDVPTRFYAMCMDCVESGTVQTLTIEEGCNYNKLPFGVLARIWPLSDDGKMVTGLLGGALFRLIEPGPLARAGA